MEVTNQLRWPAGTVRSRLARARDKIRVSLTRWGVLPIAVLATALDTKRALAQISAVMCDNTTRAVLHSAAGQSIYEAVSASAAALAQEVIRSMVLTKLKLTVLTLLILGAVATFTGYLNHSLAMKDEPGQAPTRERQGAAKVAEPSRTAVTPGRMFVVGRVLDLQGKPVPKAMTMVYAAIKQPGSRGLIEKMLPTAIGQASSDNSGRFQIDAPRTSSSRHHSVGIVALAPGFGASWTTFDLDAEQPSADITLRPEQVIQGRLFDLNGRPIQGVTVSIVAMRHILQRNANPLNERFEGPIFSWSHASDLPAWPKPAISDAEGRFTIRGAGRDLRVELIVDRPPVRPPENPGRDRRHFRIEAADAGAGAGQGCQGTRHGSRYRQGDSSCRGLGLVLHSETLHFYNDFQADAEGRFRANPLSADRYEVSAAAPEGQPYLNVSKFFNWPKGAVEYPIDLALPRGAVIRGKVTEEGSGKPVAGARISFGAHGTTGSRVNAYNGSAESGSDGSFQLAVPPSPGYSRRPGPQRRLCAPGDRR